MIMAMGQAMKIPAGQVRVGRSNEQRETNASRAPHDRSWDGSAQRGAPITSGAVYKIDMNIFIIGYNCD